MNESAKQNPFGSQTADAILQLYLILIGLGFGFGVEELLKDVSFPSAIRFLTCIVMLSTWLHGQVGYGSSETYEIKAGWLVRIIEHYVEISAGLILIAVSLSIQNTPVFYFAVVGAYALDLLLEGTYLLRLRATPRAHKKEKGVSKSWLLMDLASLILFGVLLIVRQVVDDDDLYTSLGFFLVVGAVAMWDYSRNRDFYFGL